MHLRALTAAALALILTRAPSTRAADHTILSFQCAGLDALTSHSLKDSFLRATLAALGPRLAELPAELGGDPADGVFASAFWEPMRGRTLIRLVLNDDDPAHPRVRLALEVTPIDPSQAATLARAAARAADREGLTVTDDGPLRKYTNHKGDEIAFGVNAGTFVLRINGLASAGPPEGMVIGAPADAPMLMRLRFSAPALSRAIDLAPDAHTEDSRQGRALLGTLGVYGPESITIDAAMWHGAATLEGAATVRGARPFWAPGPEAPPTIGADFLAKIPIDATALSVGACDIAGLIDRVVRAVHPGDADAAYAEAAEFLGFDPMTDLLRHIGPRFAWYQSERTGGGGLMSLVALAQVREPEAFAQTHALIVDKINNLGAGMARGYVRIDQVPIGGRQAFMLVTPGLPLPIAITWAIDRDTVIKGFSPGAFATAGVFANTRGPSIATNATLRDRAGDLAELASLSFVDAAGKARDSVGAATGLLLMLANASRMDIAGGAVPLPSAAMLAENVKPMISWSRWTGDDLAVRWSTDDSLTVLGGIVVGEYASAGMTQLVPMWMGITVPAIQKARSNAIEIQQRAPFAPPAAGNSRGVTNMCQLTIAIAAYNAQTGDRMPKSIDDLSRAGLIDAGTLKSPFGPSVFPGGADYVLCSPWDEPAKITFPSDTILIVDVAAMGAAPNRIPIGMADGSVREISADELAELLELPQHKALKTALGLD